MKRSRNEVRKPASRSRRKLFLVLGILAVLVIGGTGYATMRPAKAKPNTPSQTKSTTLSAKSETATTTPTAPVATPPPPGACAANTLSQNVIVSISKRHLWGCSGTTQDYDSAVVTGMENLPADLTPTGTYHIYGKQTDLHLRGSDSTGSWDDFVYYWMPFLSNQYGVYGFHDATWRGASDFGNIDPYSSNASHGCVELPLDTAKWLYGWAGIGTTVTIES